MYHLESAFDHADARLALEFAAAGLPAITGASWGVAKVEVRGE